MSEIRYMYLNRLRLKQDSLVIERKETGESLYDFADGCINRDVITWIKFKKYLFVDICY